MAHWGMTFPFPGVTLSDHRDWLRQLVDLGYSDLWTAEVAGADAFTPLAAAAGWVPEMRLGTGIASIFSRGPALLGDGGRGPGGACSGSVRSGYRELVAPHCRGLERRQLPATLSPDP